MKESFLLYKSFYEPVKDLPLELKGMLLDAIFQYQITGEQPEVSNPIFIAFKFIKNQFDLDDKKYQKIVERNRNNGKKGGRKKENQKTQKEAKKPSGLSGNTNKPKNPNKPKETQNKPSNPKKPDNVNDNVNENGTVNDNDYKKKLLSDLKESDFYKPIYFKITKTFHALFKKNLQDLNMSTDGIDKAKGKWIDSIRLMFETDKRTLTEVKEVFKVLQVNEFWKFNVLSTDKLRKQFEKLLIESRKNGKTTNNNKEATSWDQLATIIQQYPDN